MSWKAEFKRLAEPASQKVAPSFGAHHAAVALLMIGREQPLGRYELCENLSVGEGSARTLLKRLTESGYIAPEGKLGQRLTESGQTLFERVSLDIPMGLFLELEDLVIHEFSFANLVRNRSHRVKDGVRQRDEAIIQGGYARAGATTLVQKDGILVMPPGDFNALLASESETLLIIETIRPEENDVIVIGSAESGSLAREVAMAAAMTLFDEE